MEGGGVVNEGWEWCSRGFAVSVRVVAAALAGIPLLCESEGSGLRCGGGVRGRGLGREGVDDSVTLPTAEGYLLTSLAAEEVSLKEMTDYHFSHDTG